MSSYLRSGAKKSLRKMEQDRVERIVKKFNSRGLNISVKEINKMIKSNGSSIK